MRRLVPLLFFAISCGGGEGPDPCEQGPTFADDIAPVIEDHCMMCHDQGLQGPARRGAPMGVNFNSYETLEPYIAQFADNITSGRMPPMNVAGTVPVAAPHRNVVDAWRRCGFPK